MSTHIFFRTARQTFEIMVGALVMLHLTPLIPFAGATGYMPLNETRVIDRNILRLSDIFTNLDPRKDQAIGPAPRPGQDMTLNARTLMKLAVAYNVKWSPSSTEDRVIIRREGEVIPAEKIETHIHETLVKQGAPDPFSLSFENSPTSFYLQKGEKTDLSTQNITFNPVTNTFSLSIHPVDLPTAVQTLRGRIDPLVNIPVAARTVEKGSIIHDGDIETMLIKASMAKGDIALSRPTIVGQVARRNILSGKPFKVSDLDSPISVTRGDKVLLIYKTGILELSAQGRALQDGRIGERVNVINTASNKSLQGTVISSGQIMID